MASNTAIPATLAPTIIAICSLSSGFGVMSEEPAVGATPSLPDEEEVEVVVVVVVVVISENRQNEGQNEAHA